MPRRRTIERAPRYPNRIRALRTAAGMSQEALGERLGVTFSAIGKLERGDTRLRTDQAQALSVVFGVHELELFLPLAAEERELLKLMRSAPPDLRARVVQMVRMMLDPLPSQQPAKVA